MPRVEVIPEGWSDSEECRQGEGTPTFDLCNFCVVGISVKNFISGNTLPKNFKGEMGSLDVDHPDYGECDYCCEICGRVLDNRHN